MWSRRPLIHQTQPIHYKFSLPKIIMNFFVTTLCSPGPLYSVCSLFLRQHKFSLGHISVLALIQDPVRSQWKVDVQLVMKNSLYLKTDVYLSSAWPPAYSLPSSLHSLNSSPVVPATPHDSIPTGTQTELCLFYTNYAGIFPISLFFHFWCFQTQC